MQTDKLVTMANQIGSFFATQRGDPAEATAAHIRKFWNPTMREGFLDRVEACDGHGVSEVAHGAARCLRPDMEPSRLRAAG